MRCPRRFQGAMAPTRFIDETSGRGDVSARFRAQHAARVGARPAPSRARCTWVAERYNGDSSCDIDGRQRRSKQRMARRNDLRMARRMQGSSVALLTAAPRPVVTSARRSGVLRCSLACREARCYISDDRDRCRSVRSGSDRLAIVLHWRRSGAPVPLRHRRATLGVRAEVSRAPQRPSRSAVRRSQGQVEAPLQREAPAPGAGLGARSSS